MIKTETGKFFLGACYLAVLFLFFNSNTMFINWILLELNVLLFVLLLFNWQENPSSQFYYFLVQRFSSFIFLYYAVGNYLFWDRSSLFFLGLFIKCGFFPFHSWYYKFCIPLRWVSLATVLSIQKLPSLVILFRFYDNSFLQLFLLNGLFGSFMILSSNYLRALLVSSSIYVGYWMYLLFSFSNLGFLLFYVVYTLTLYICLYLIGVWRSSESDRSIAGVYILMPFLSGLPPFNVFFIKYYLLRLAYFSLGRIQLLLIWRITFVSVIGYLWFFLKKLLAGFSPWGEPAYSISLRILIVSRTALFLACFIR